MLKISIPTPETKKAAKDRSITNGYWNESQTLILYFVAYFLLNTVARDIDCTPIKASDPPKTILPSSTKPVSFVIKR